MRKQRILIFAISLIVTLAAGTIILALRLSEMAAVADMDEIPEKDTETEIPETEKIPEKVVLEIPEEPVEEDSGEVSENGIVSEDTAETAETETEETEESEEQEAVSDNLAEDMPEDLLPPCILSFTATPVIQPGEEFDIHRYIGYADDVDRDVELKVSGEVDVNTVGVYPLEITLTDDAGHVTSRKMDVGVMPDIPGGDTKPVNTEEFSDFYAKYKNEQSCVGIDVSRWQEAIDFERVKAAGCEFVYIRIGGLDDGELYTDRYYAANIAAAKAAGLSIGIYWHAEEKNAEEVRKSVAYLCDVLAGIQPELPIAYDWEDFKNFENYGMNLQDINNNLSVFMEELKAKGYRSCLYSSKFFCQNVWRINEDIPLWLAHYTKATDYAGDHFMWQHSCTGHIDGIEGAVDLDVFYPGRLK